MSSPNRHYVWLLYKTNSPQGNARGLLLALETKEASHGDDESPKQTFCLAVLLLEEKTISFRKVTPGPPNCRKDHKKIPHKLVYYEPPAYICINLCGAGGQKLIIAGCSLNKAVM